MGRKNELTSEEKTCILLLRRINPGWSGRRIAEEVNRSTSAVYRFLRDPEGHGQSPRSSRPRKLSQWRVTRIRRLAKLKKMSAATIKTHLDLGVHRATVSRRIAEDSNLFWSKMARKPPLTSVHQTARLNFAFEHIALSAEWRRVVFSDEKKFNLEGPDGFRYYWHDLREEPATLSKRHSGGGSLMVWGAISYGGKTELVTLRGKIDSRRYQDTLADHLLLLYY